MSADCPVFYALYQAMGGTDTTLTQTNCCTWRARVICSEGRLQRVNLNENYLNGTITSDIGKLDALRIFSVAANNLTGELPPEMAKLSLSVLDVDENNFYGEIPAIQPNTSFGTPRFEMYLNSFSGYIPDSLANANLTTIDPENNNGCPYDANLCVKTKPLHCENVQFSCTTLPHRFYPDSQNATANGMLAHPLRLIIGIVVVVAVISMAAIGATFYNSRRKRTESTSSPSTSPQSPPKEYNDLKMAHTQRYVNQQMANNGYHNERYSKAGSSETSVSQYSPSLVNSSPISARQYPDKEGTVSSRSSNSTAKAPIQSPLQSYRRETRNSPMAAATEMNHSNYPSPRNTTLPTNQPREYQVSVGSPVVNPGVMQSPTTENAMPPVLMADTVFASNQSKTRFDDTEPHYDEYSDYEGAILPPVISDSYLETRADRRESETLPPVIRGSFLRRYNDKGN
ncbi:hypothetical protein HDV01_006493 [Terramyces sp. JEL0728]|nr:hypothetical protein HDV01_006493 [Terramyces sp. JEL0728]